MRAPPSSHAPQGGNDSHSVHPLVPNCVHGWLAAVVPVEARRFRVACGELAGTLADAGAELADADADVDILCAGDSPEADQVIVQVSADQPEGGGIVRRAYGRLACSARVRVDAARSRRALAAQRYGSVDVIAWDCEAPIFLRGVAGRLRDHRPAHLLPRSALVVGARRRAAQTVLEAVAAETAAMTGRPVRYRWPLASEGLTVAVADDCVLRVAVGPGRARVEKQRDALSLLATAEPSATIGDRVPWLVAEGRTGLADWSAEHKLPGGHPAAPSQAVVEDCLAFLVALYDVSDDRDPRTSPLDDAQVVASFCRGAEAADAVRALGAFLDVELGGLPRGFGHGDFWWRNLLATGDRLAGVIEWDAAGPGRLPLLDLLHLITSIRRQRTRRYLGVAVVEDLLPWARDGGDELVRSYCDRIGVRLEPGWLELLALAYWLDRVAFDLRTFADRGRRDVWLRNNVDFTAEWLAGDRRLSRVTDG